MKPTSVLRAALVCSFYAVFWAAPGGPPAARDIHVAMTGDVITVREGIYR